MPRYGEFEEEGDTGRRIANLIIGFVVVFVALLIVFNIFYIVPAGYRGVLLTWGKASDTAVEEGLHIKVPIMQSVVIMEVRTQKYEADASASSKDLQVVSAKIATNYHLVPTTVPTLYTQLGEQYRETIIQPMEQEVVKATTAQFTAEELITKRESVRQEIKESMTTRLGERGIIVEEVSITNFDFSDEFNKAIEQKVTAQQLYLKSQNDLERIKVEAQQAQAVAVGKKEATIAEAQGQAEAIRIINEQLLKSAGYVDYLRVQRWDGRTPLVVGSGGATPFLTISTNSTGV